MQDFQNLKIENFPDISKVEFKSIPKKYLKVIGFNFLSVFLLLFTGLFFLIEFKVIEEILEYVFYLYLFYCLAFLFTLSLLLLGFKKRKYVVREKDISYKSGVFFKKMVTVPFSRVQHIEVDEDPISRIFNLASLSVYTAGDSSDDLEVKGISKEEALKIKEFISLQING